MKALFFNVQLAKPLLLWFVLALPVLWFRFRDRPLAVILWRTLIVLLLILSLADPQSVSEQSRDEERIFAFDLSQSVPATMRRWMERVTQENLTPKRQDRVFVFGSDIKEAGNWREWLRVEGAQLDALRPEKTNLEKLFINLLALPATPRSLFLFTDGWETQGNVERLLPAIGGAGLKVYPILPTDRPKIHNVAVTKLLAPTHGSRGESVNVRVVLENQSDREIEGALALTHNGQALKTEPVKLKPGSRLFTYPATLPDGALTSYRATFTPRRPELDLNSVDNQAFAWVAVKTKAKVLLLNGRASGGRYLEAVLKRRGFEVTSRTAESPPPPTGYAVVIFNNVERERFSSGYLAAIERHVAEGNGFVMLGDEASFAPGSYRHTPIETILPVEPREPKREEKNRAVVLVIDKSGSMREGNRILYAQEAAKLVARQLKDNDLLGVVGFDVSPFVVVPLEQVGKLRGVFDSRIDRLKPGGQTYFYPALTEAKRQLEKQSAGIKHAILLSDGETRGSQGELIDLVTVMKNEMKITVSAVAIGAEADVRIMKRISQYGGGLFHHTFDPTTLPQVVLQQIQDRPRNEPLAERDLFPVQERGSELLAGLPERSFPAVRGYMETDLKRGARMDLSILKDDRKAPLLASWRYGRGKSVALTTDLEGRWSRNWIQWSGLQSFWDKVLDWLRPSEESIPLHEARVSPTANQPLLELYLYEDTGADSQFRFSLSGKGGRAEGVLKKLAPGHYQAPLPITAAGDYRIELSEERRGRRVAYPPVGYTQPQELNSEKPRPEFNNDLLSKLAQVSGGEFNPKSPELLYKHGVTKIFRPLRQPLILLIFCLFLLEIAARKLLFSERD